MKFHSLEGNTQRLDGGAMFGNVPRALWSRWITPDDQHRIPLACRSLLVEGLHGKRVLFETGIGAFFEPRLRERYGVEQAGHRLLESLAALRLTDADIDVVVLSHLHFDHAGGLLAAWEDGQSPRLLFPNATFLVGHTHWQRAVKPHPRDRASFIPELLPLLEASGRVEFVDGSHSHALGHAVRFTESDGHTPGLMLSEIRGPQAGGGGGVVYCADLIPGRAWVHLPVTMGYDRYPELLIEEKRAFLEDKLARDVQLFFTHDSECAMARVVRDPSSGKFGTADERASVSGWSP